MKRMLLYCCLLAAAAPLSLGCSSKDAPPPNDSSKPPSNAGAQPSNAGAPPINAPAPQASAGPDRVKVNHVLIAFRGSLPAGTQMRTKEEAKTLAESIFQRAQSGENFDALMKQSDDGGGGVYTLVARAQDAIPFKIYARAGMVPGFGDTSFALKVGEVGMCPFDPNKSPYGWHIIKRVE
jgi:hypothetical protein